MIQLAPKSGCKALTDSTYKPNLPKGKYIGSDLSTEKKQHLKEDLEEVMEHFTTNTVVAKLATCSSTQRNEALHNVVGTMAPKRLHFGRSNQYNTRYSTALNKLSKGPQFSGMHQILID